MNDKGLSEEEARKGVFGLYHKLQGLQHEIDRKKQVLVGKEDNVSLQQKKLLAVFLGEIEKALSSLAPVISLMTHEEENH